MTAEMQGGRSEAAGGGRRAGAVCGAGVKVHTLCSSRCRARLPESRHKQSCIHVWNTILYRGGQGSEAGTCVVQKTTNTAPARNTPTDRSCPQAPRPAQPQRLIRHSWTRSRAGVAAHHSTRSGPATESAESVKKKTHTKCAQRFGMRTAWRRQWGVSDYHSIGPETWNHSRKSEMGCAGRPVGVRETPPPSKVEFPQFEYQNDITILGPARSAMQLTHGGSRKSRTAVPQSKPKGARTPQREGSGGGWLSVFKPIIAVSRTCAGYR
jgi:hypothetical protein